MLFRSAVREMHDQYIDNINVFYVALTRAVKSLTVIAEIPKDSIRTGVESSFANFSQLLYLYFSNGHAEAQTSSVTEEDTLIFRIGEPYDFATMSRKDSGMAEIVPGYPSIPLNPEPGDEETDVRERGRLKFGADSIDFFNDEATASKSSRLNGSVMHSILSSVGTSSDLEAAVERAEIGRAHV